MSDIMLTSTACIAALQNNQPVVFTQQGEWVIEGAAKRSCRKLKGMARIQAMASGFITQLDRLEKEPVRFGAPVDTKATTDKFKAWITVAREVESSLLKKLSKHTLGKRKIDTSLCNPLKKLAHQLQLRIVGLNYRIGGIYGGLCRHKEPHEASYRELKGWAEEWKQHTEIFPDPKLDSANLRQIELAACYPKFVDYLRSFPGKRTAFFNWALRDHLSVNTFVQFPAIAKWIKISKLTGRLGYWGPELTNVKAVKCADGATEKHVQLPFDHQLISLLDRTQKVTFQYGYTLSLDDIFKVFSQKKLEIGKIEFIGKRGFTNYNPLEWGYWNPETNSYERLDFSKDDFYRQLEEQERLTTEEVQYRYHITPKPGEYFKVISASRTDVKYMELSGTHGWKELGIPNDDGTWTVIFPGRYTNPYPVGALSIFLFLTKTVKACVSSHDENNLSYTERQFAVHAEIISEKHFNAHIADLKKQLLRTFSGGSCYQISGKNCAHWPAKSSEKIHGLVTQGGTAFDYFRTDIVKINSRSIIGKVMRFIGTHSRSLQRIWLKFMAFVMGGWRRLRLIKNGKRVSYNLLGSKYMSGSVLLPPQLHEQIKAGKISGHIGAGNGWRHPEGVASQYRGQLKALKYSS